MARVLLLVLQRIFDAVGDMLDKRTAKHDIEQLFAAANAKYGHVAVECAAGDRIFELRALILGDDRRMPFAGAIEIGRNVERAAGDDKPVDHIQIDIHKMEFMRQPNRHGAKIADCREVILAQGVPRQPGIAPSCLVIEGKTNDRRGY